MLAHDASKKLAFFFFLSSFSASVEKLYKGFTPRRKPSFFFPFSFPSVQAILAGSVRRSTTTEQTLPLFSSPFLYLSLRLWAAINEVKILLFLFFFFSSPSSMYATSIRKA